MTDRTYQFTVLDDANHPSTLTQAEIDRLFDSVGSYEDVFYDAVEEDLDDNTVDFATLTVSDGGPVRWHGACLSHVQTQHLFSQIVHHALIHAATVVPADQ